VGEKPWHEIANRLYFSLAMDWNRARGKRQEDECGVKCVKLHSSEIWQVSKLLGRQPQGRKPLGA